MISKLFKKTEKKLNSFKHTLKCDDNEKEELERKLDKLYKHIDVNYPGFEVDVKYSNLDDFISSKYAKVVQIEPSNIKHTLMSPIRVYNLSNDDSACIAFGNYQGKSAPNLVIKLGEDIYAFYATKILTS